MPAVYPTTLPQFDEPTAPASTPLSAAGGPPNARTHVEHHRDLGDELRALAIKVGIDGSADTTTIDYRLATVESGFAAHLIDPTDAHDASAISFVPTGTIASTDVQAAIAEVASEAAGAVSSVDGRTGVVTLSDLYLDTGQNLGDVADAAASRANLGLAIGVNVQAQDGELSALAALTSAADKLPYFTGSGTAALADFTTFGRSLVDDADATAARTTLGLGTSATRDAGVANGVATLDGSGLVPQSQIPAVAISDTFVVASQAAMLALSAQTGDVAVRSDLNKSFILKGTDPTVLGDWQELLTPTDTVLSVDGRTGVVTLSDLYQPLDGELTALAGLSSSADKVPYFTGAGTASTATLTSFGRSLIDDADSTAGRATLGVVIGTDVQAYDAELAALAGLTSAADRLPYFTGSGTASLATFTSFGRSLVDDADAATARTTLGLGTSATVDTANPLAASKIPIADSIADLYLHAADTTWADVSSGGGFVRHAKGYLVNPQYTQTATPGNSATDLTRGTGFLFLWNATENYAGGLAGPIAQGGGNAFGPRGAFQVEGTIRYNFGIAASIPPVGFANQTFVRNQDGTAMNMTGSFGYIDSPIYFADNATVTLKHNDTSIGPTGFIANAIISGSGTGIYDGLTNSAGLVGFLTALNVVNSAQMAEVRHYDINALAVSGGSASVTTQTGYRAPRLTTATNNWAASFDSPVLLWTDSPGTFTAEPGGSNAAILATYGSWTVDYSNAKVVTPYYFGPTVTFAQDGNVFGSYLGFNSSPTIKNKSTSTGVDFGPMMSFRASPTITADTKTDPTVSTLYGFYSAPTVNRTNSGALAVTLVSDHRSDITIGAGATVTTRRAFDAADASNSGTLTTQIGFHAPRMTAGGTNWGLYSDTPIGIFNDTATVTANQTMVTTAPTLTIDASSAQFLGYSASGTIKFKQAGNALGSYRFLSHTMTLRNDTALTGALGAAQVVYNSPTIIGDTNATTMSSLKGFVDAPTINTASGGTMTVTTLNAFEASLTITAGTVTTRNGLVINDVTNSGTLTNQYGIDIARLTAAGTTNIGIRNNSPHLFWGDTATFTASVDPTAQAPLYTNGTFTYSTSADLPHGVLLALDTIVVNTTLNAFAVPYVFKAARTYKSDTSTTNRDLKQMRTFWDNNTVTADNSDDTMSSYYGFLSNPSFTVTGATSPTLALTDLFNYQAGGSTVNAGVTITNRYGLQVADLGGSGTLTNQYGVDIAALTEGTTLNIGLRNASPTVFTPSSAQTLAAGTTILANATVVQFNSSGAVTLTSTPHIADGQDGQILVLVNVDSADAVTFRDQSAIASNLRLPGAANLVLGPRDTAVFVYSSSLGDWICVATSNN